MAVMIVNVSALLVDTGPADNRKTILLSSVQLSCALVWVSIRILAIFKCLESISYIQAWPGLLLFFLNTSDWV